jgi:hypothetical protein
MTKWKGKSRGTVLGLKSYVLIIKTFGLNAAYFILLFVVSYFIIFSFNSTKSTWYFFKKRIKYSSLSAAIQVYISYFTFGKIQLDRLAIASGLKHKYTFEFDGIQHIRELLKKKKGGILLTAHIGNFNLAEHFFADRNIFVNLVLTDLEHKQIKNYFESVSGKSRIRIIVMKDDFTHIFKINEALKNNELLVFAADRYLENTKTYTHSFLGKPVQFPVGPFKLAARNSIPVLFVHIMRERNFHYHLYARSMDAQENSAKEILKAYLKNLGNMAKKYPHQWYNYYDYWNDFK